MHPGVRDVFQVDRDAPPLRFVHSLRFRTLWHFPITSTLLVSLPGLIGQSCTHGRRLLDRPGEPGGDSGTILLPPTPHPPKRPEAREKPASPPENARPPPEP